MTAPATQAPQLLLTIIVDTSTSMATAVPAMHRAVQAALDVTWGAMAGLTSTRLGVITAGAQATVAQPLDGPVEPGTLAAFEPTGTADMAGAIALLGDEFERSTMGNLSRDRRTLRPWVLLLSDGRWHRDDAAMAMQRLHAPPTRPVVCPVGVGDVDETTLARLATDLGLAVDTPDDLETVLPELVRAIIAADGEGARLVAPTGSRPLEGW